MPTVVSVFGVQPTRIGGTETFARELSLQLAQHGWESVLCFETEPTDEVKEFLSLPNVTLDTLDELTNSNWNSTKQFARMLRKYRPDILHLHFTGFVSTFPWVARVFAVNKIFFTDHSSRPAGYVPSRAPQWKRMLVRMINLPTTKVICVSKYGLKCMTALELLEADRFALVYNGVDLSRVNQDPSRGLEFRKAFSIADDSTVVLQVSWIIPEKGIEDLLQVAKFVQSHNEKIQFVIVGDGPERERYMKQANEMGLSRTVTWAGLVRDPFTEGVFDAADIVCQLSRWEELFGWMIAEAMAYARPIVATRVGGIPELVDDGRSGYLVDRGDIKEASRMLVELVNKPELRTKMGQTGKAIVESNFSLQKNVHELLSLYGFN
jgi:glycosyltransferase involved in cell wall biosynthesis